MLMMLMQFLGDGWFVELRRRRFLAVETFLLAYKKWGENVFELVLIFFFVKRFRKPTSSPLYFCLFVLKICTFMELWKYIYSRNMNKTDGNLILFRKFFFLRHFLFYQTNLKIIPTYSILPIMHTVNLSTYLC